MNDMTKTTQKMNDTTQTTQKTTITGDAQGDTPTHRCTERNADNKVN
jgi:hypothetical protein